MNLNKTLLKAYLQGELVDHERIKQSLLDFSVIWKLCDKKKCRGICYLRQNLNWFKNIKGMNTLCSIMFTVCNEDIPFKWPPKQMKKGKHHYGGKNHSSRRSTRQIQSSESTNQQEKSVRTVVDG